MRHSNLMKIFGAGILVVLLLPIKLASAQTFKICHGYECYYQTKVMLSLQHEKHIQNLLKQGNQSADAERKALRQAIAKFEQHNTAVIGVQDKPKMQFGKARIKGQMDCIDESMNTDNFLRFLQLRGWLKHHTVAPRISRGIFIDGRYPHWSAAIKDKDGVIWAVDSWYEPGGGLPDILPLREWKQRGYMGER